MCLCSWPPVWYVWGLLTQATPVYMLGLGELGGDSCVLLSLP